MPAIASTFVEMLPETSKLADGLRRAFREADPIAREAGSRWGREIEQGIGRPTVQLGADTTKARSEIDQAARDRKLTVTVDVDRQRLESEIAKTEAAIARLGNKQADAAGQARVAKEAQTEAEARYQALQDKGTARASTLARAEEAVAKARRDSAMASLRESTLRDQISTLKVKVEDAAKAKAEIDAIARDRTVEIKADANALGSSIESGITQGGQAGIGALQPALLGVGATMLAGIASALSGLAGLVPAGLAGAGGLVGTLAIGLDGVKDAYDAVNKAAQSSGQDQIDKARETATAQRGLTDAVQAQAQAQRDVSTAYRDAKNNLDDLNLSLQGGKISEAQAYNNVLKARRDLARGGFKDAIDQQDAILRVQSAEQQWQESKQRNVELQQKANDASTKGVENSDQVVSAKERERKANEQVTAAQQSLDQATAKTSDTAKSAMQAMAQLSPNAQAFVNTLMAMKPAFQEFKSAIQDALFANIGPQFQQLATTYMPLLRQLMTGMASTMNQAFGQIAGFLQQPATMQAMQQIFANIGSSFQIWSQALQPFSEAFLKVTQVGSTFLPQLAQMVVQVAQAFNQWAQSGQLGTWIQTGMTALQQLGGLVQQLLPMFAQLAPIGIATMSGLQTIFAALAPSIGPLASAFTSLIVAITPILGVIGQLVSVVITSVAPALTTWLNALAPVIQQMAGALQPVLQALAPVLQQTAGILAQAMVQGIKTLLPVLVPFVEQAGKLLVAVLPLLPSLTQLAISLMPSMQQVVAAILPTLTEFVKKLTDLANLVIPPLSQAITLLSGTASLQFKGLKDAVTTMWDVVKPILETMKTLVEAIAGPLSKIGDFYNTIFGSADSNALDKVNQARAAQGLPPLGPGGQAPVGGSTLPRTVPAPGVTAPNGITPIGPPFTGLPSTGGVGGSGTSGLTPVYKPPTAPYWGPAATPSSMTKDQVAQLIISEAQRRGFSREQTLAVLSTGLQESGLSPTASGGGGAWHGIFQQDTTYPGRDDPTANIGAFFDRLGAPGSDIWSQIFQLQQGTPLNSPKARTGYLSEIQSQLGPATSLYNQLTGGTASDPMTAMPATAGLPTAGLPDAHGAHQQIAMVEQIAQKFGLTLTAGKDDHPVDNGFHPLGEAGDFSNGSGNTPQELAFAQYMAQNFAPYIQELIYSDPNFNQLIGGGKNVSGAGYYSASTLADHTDHVHVAIKDEFAQAFAQASGSQYGPGLTGGPSGTAQDPMYVALPPEQQKQQGGPGQQLGQDFLSGIGQIFGLDGSVFKDPTSFGLFKIFKGIMGLKPAGGDGSSVSGGVPGGSGSGGSLIGGLLQGIIPQPFGNLMPGSPTDAPGQFMPLMPGSGGGGGINFPQTATSGQKGAPGPGNQVDASINFNGPVYGSPQPAMSAATDANVPRMRQGIRPLP